MSDKKSRTARIKERIAETTAAAKEFIPVEHGPDPRLHRHEVNHAVHQQKEAAAGSFEEAFDYEDPNSERFLPEGMDGVIQIKTREEVAGEEAYAKALKDPMSVLAPRQKYDENDLGGKRTRTIVDAGHELAKKQISEAHRSDWREIARKGIGVGEDGSDPKIGPGHWAADGSGFVISGPVGDALDRESRSPHAPSVGCSGCGGPVIGSSDIGENGDIYCSSCRLRGLDKI